ncbi:MAG: MotE family protein [Alphaproteobacteria bacterium]|nr:MotE family protein [Alphaproteobacteria bacterium]
MGFSSFRILPLMIVVAMLAFSVRLAEVYMGFAALSKAAYAEDAKHAEEKKPEEAKKEEHAAETPAADKKEEKKDEKTAKTPEPPGPLEMKADKKGALEFPDPKAPGKDGKTINWQDASDARILDSDVRATLGEDLVKRKAELDKREQDLCTRDALLKAGEQELDQKIKELSQLRGEMEKLLQTQSDEEQARVGSLVKIYEGMKPKDAARIFDTLDLDILVTVMGKMSERKLSPILAAMNPDRARTITIMLAEQKKLPELPSQ